MKKKKKKINENKSRRILEVGKGAKKKVWCLNVKIKRRIGVWCMEGKYVKSIPVA